MNDVPTWVVAMLPLGGAIFPRLVVVAIDRDRRSWWEVLLLGIPLANASFGFLLAALVIQFFGEMPRGFVYKLLSTDTWFVILSGCLWILIRSVLELWRRAYADKNQRVRWTFMYGWSNAVGVAAYAYFVVSM